MVIASFLVFIFYIGSISLVGESFGDGAIIEEKVSKGTFMLLNNSLDGLSKQQTDKLVKEYQALFGDSFMLLETSELNIDDDDMVQLKNNKIVSIEETEIYNDSNRENLDDLDTVTILYSQRPNSTQVWRLELGYKTYISINESGLFLRLVSGDFSNGMMTLIQTQLLSNGSEDWERILKSLEPEFGLPLKLLTFEQIPSDIDGGEKLLSSLRENKTVNISQGTKVATFVKQIPNSQQLLQVGPISIPWYIRNMPLLFILAVVLSFATTLLIWLWPLWSNLIKIKRASDEFGAGNYDARIPLSRLSPIKNISMAFNNMAEQTQRGIRSQKELTSAVSHELRTPVARMRFALEMLDASSEKKDKSRYVKAINEDIDELDLLLEELLTYARFDQNDKTILTHEPLISWISSSMEKLIPLAVDRSLSYKIEGIGSDEIGFFEPRLMTRVLDNLVQNALRYSKERVNVTLTKDNSGNVLLIVEDDGEGIPMDKREHIFDAFSRIDASRDRASGGFGLGLAIVDRIIKAHHGAISIQDSALGGARFVVRIPAKK